MSIRKGDKLIHRVGDEWQQVVAAGHEFNGMAAVVFLTVYGPVIMTLPVKILEPIIDTPPLASLSLPQANDSALTPQNAGSRG